MELMNALVGHSRGGFPVERGQGYEQLLVELFTKAQGHTDHTYLNENPHYGITFANVVWESHPYCWCEKEDCPQCGITSMQANFWYKPTDLQIQWYKYPLRDAYSNVELKSVSEFAKIIEHCTESLFERKVEQ